MPVVWRIKERREERKKTHKLIDTLLNTLTPSINDITTVILWSFEQVFHETSETRQVGCNVGNTHYCTFCGGVSEWFVWKSVFKRSENPRRAKRGEVDMISSHTWQRAQGGERARRPVERRRRGGEKEDEEEGKEHTVRRENTHMTTPNKLFVIQTEDRVVRIQEFRMENNLNPISRPVEQLNSSDLVQDGIVGVVGHVVCGDWG
jgi:hypothetical protein